jgi:hypothetical protein
MANTLSTTGISSNSIIKPEHISQSIDAFTGVEAYDITLSGSLSINGPLNLDTPPDRKFNFTCCVFCIGFICFKCSNS